MLLALTPTLSRFGSHCAFSFPPWLHVEHGDRWGAVLDMSAWIPISNDLAPRRAELKNDSEFCILHALHAGSDSQIPMLLDLPSLIQFFSSVSHVQLKEWCQGWQDMEPLLRTSASCKHLRSPRSLWFFPPVPLPRESSALRNMRKTPALFGCWRCCNLNFGFWGLMKLAFQNTKAISNKKSKHFFFWVIPFLRQHSS